MDTDFGGAGLPQAGSYGGVLLNAKGEVLLIRPAGQFGGYAWTFPKARPKPGEAPQAAALRAVRQEAGYTAKPLRALPGAYEGTTGKSAFLLAAPLGRRRKPAPGTEDVRWASFDEAGDLIGQTKTPEGRRRDLSILWAAKCATADLEADEQPGTCREDWKARPLPRLRKRIGLNLIYAPWMMDRIRRGILPHDMDDRWFIWFDEPFLYCHRSWTGHCIFRVHFEAVRDGFVADWMEANRDPKQYGPHAKAPLKEDRNTVHQLIDQLFMVSGRSIA